MPNDSLLTENQRDTEDLCAPVLFVNLMLLLQFRLVQITLNEVCLWLNYSDLLENYKWEESDGSTGNT